jgi:crotonobetainyl-CoA:carnitine CoA-transferase CaiB-like acyl-CoA transferase
VVAHVGLVNDGTAPAPGAGLLHGGAPCYNLYRTRDGRWLAVAALELKFWETLCTALNRPDWAKRHWSLGQALGGADAVALTQELMALFATRTLAEWIELLEPLNCCVAPVLTPAEAAQHPLFAPELYTSATAAGQDDYANNTGDSAIPQEWSGAKTVKGYES